MTTWGYGDPKGLTILEVDFLGEDLVFQRATQDESGMEEMFLHDCSLLRSNSCSAPSLPAPAAPSMVPAHSHLTHLRPVVSQLHTRHSLYEKANQGVASFPSTASFYWEYSSVLMQELGDWKEICLTKVLYGEALNCRCDGMIRYFSPLKYFFNLSLTFMSWKLMSSLYRCFHLCPPNNILK